MIRPCLQGTVYIQMTSTGQSRASYPFTIAPVSVLPRKSPINLPVQRLLKGSHGRFASEGLLVRPRRRRLNFQLSPYSDKSPLPKRGRFLARKGTGKASSQRPSPGSRSPVSVRSGQSEARLPRKETGVGKVVVQLYRNQLFRDVFQVDGTHRKELITTEDEESLEVTGPFPKVVFQPREMHVLDGEEPEPSPMPRTTQKDSRFRLLQQLRNRSPHP